MDGNIGLVFATEVESKPFIKGFDLPRIEKKPFEVFNRDNIFLIRSGIGKANAAIATSYLIWKYNMDVIFNIGAAGATTLENKLGDIFHIESVVEYDRPRLIKKGIRILKPDIIPGFPSASLATQDKPVMESGHRMLMSKYADLVDMEGAAVIQACRLWGVKSYLFKYVTDTPEHEEKDIIENINTIGKSMFDFFKIKILKI